MTHLGEYRSTRTEEARTRKGRAFSLSHSLKDVSAFSKLMKDRMLSGEMATKPQSLVESIMIKPHHCPVCEKQFDTSDGTVQKLFPFCSARCRQVDLFRWADGRYAIVEDVDPMVAEFMQHDPNITVADPSEDK